jgi:hypothetical protein
VTLINQSKETEFSKIKGWSDWEEWVFLTALLKWQDSATGFFD